MFKKKVYSDFVDLSLGRVYIRPLTNKMYDTALLLATVHSVVSNAVFLAHCERKMTQLRFWQWGQMTIKDGNILREKIKNMLKEDGIVKDEIKVENEKDVADLNAKINPADLQWFSTQRSRMGAK